MSKKPKSYGAGGVGRWVTIESKHVFIGAAGGLHFGLGAIHEAHAFAKSKKEGVGETIHGVNLAEHVKLHGDLSSANSTYELNQAIRKNLPTTAPEHLTKDLQIDYRNNVDGYIYHTVNEARYKQLGDSALEKKHRDIAAEHKVVYEKLGAMSTADVAALKKRKSAETRAVKVEASEVKAKSDKKHQEALAEAAQIRQKLLDSGSALGITFITAQLNSGKSGNTKVDLSESTNSSHKNAVEWFNKVTAVASRNPGNVKVKVKDGGIRAHHVGGAGHDSEVVIDHNTGASILVHELGHHLEHANPEILAKVNAHIKSRTKGEKLVSMKDAAHSEYYGSSEKTRPDKFAHPYMGKDYGGTASEFMAMSLQFLYNNPKKFAREDPESFDFAIAILKGGF